MMRRSGVAVLLASALLALAACGGSDEIVENLIESSSGDDISIDIDDDTVSMTLIDDDGAVVVIGSGADVPDDFPVPVPAGATVVASVDTPDEAGLNLQYDAGAYESLVAEYEKWIADQSFHDLQTSTSDVAGARSVQWFTPVGGIFIAVTQAGDLSSVIINVNK